MLCARFRRSVRRGAALALALLAAAPRIAAAAPVPFWGAREPEPVGTDPEKLKPGQFLWDAGAAPDGPLVIVVSIPQQIAKVYRNGVRIGAAGVSTGKPGHETPTGIFTILAKDKDHYSKTYNNAPMPYAERLTWDGVALHAGGLPGYPESHGCVHLPSRFAELLFGVTSLGITVVIANAATAPVDVVHPGFMAPVDAKGAEDVEPRLPAGDTFRWQPEKSATGPITVVVSGADRRILVMRNGVEIGRAAITIVSPEKPIGTEAFILKSEPGSPANPDTSGRNALDGNRAAGRPRCGRRRDESRECVPRRRAGALRGRAAQDPDARRDALRDRFPRARADDRALVERRQLGSAGREVGTPRKAERASQSASG